MEDVKQPSATIIPPKKRNNVKKFLWWFFISCMILFAVLTWFLFYYDYSDGERTGLFTKLSHKGNIFKTYEGEILVGNNQQSPNVMIPEKFVFSVDDKILADSLMKIQGKIITVKYLQYHRTLPWRGESEYIVTGLEKVQP